MYVGLALVFGCLTFGLQPIAILVEACAIASAICLLGAVVALFKRDARAYDLESLRDIHEREILKQLELDQSPEFDSVVCLNCGEVYTMRLPICPICKSPQGQPPCR